MSPTQDTGNNMNTAQDNNPCVAQPLVPGKLYRVRDHGYLLSIAMCDIDRWHAALAIPTYAERQQTVHRIYEEVWPHIGRNKLMMFVQARKTPANPLSGGTMYSGDLPAGMYVGQFLVVDRVLDAVLPCRTVEELWLALNAMLESVEE